MNNIQTFKNILPIIYPEFYKIRINTGEELIFLDHNDKESIIETDVLCNDKTQLEAVSNHIHLFDKIRTSDFEDVKIIGESLAKNLLQKLTYNYPKKKFVIYLDINIKDSAIIRFHQKWDDEPEYYNIQDFNSKFQKVFSYKNF